MTQIKTKKVRNTDDVIIEVAKIFEKTPDYIRKVMADTKAIKYKGPKPMAIRQAYLKYKHGKQRIINQLQQLKQAA